MKAKHRNPVTAAVASAMLVSMAHAGQIDGQDYATRTTSNLQQCIGDQSAETHTDVRIYGLVQIGHAMITARDQSKSLDEGEIRKMQQVLLKAASAASQAQLLPDVKATHEEWLAHFFDFLPAEQKTFAIQSADFSAEICEIYLKNYQTREFQTIGLLK